MSLSRKIFNVAFAVLVSVSLGSCARKAATQSAGATTPAPVAEARPALLAEWTGPYGGVPPWDKIQPKEFPAAFDTAIAEATQEIQAIAKNPQPPTFENTIVAMEKAGDALNRLEILFSVHVGNLNTKEMSAIQNVVNPKLSTYEDSLTQNTALFERVAAVYKMAENLGPAERRLAENTFKSFVRQGAMLDDEQKKKLSSLNLELSRLSTLFGENMLHDEEDVVTWVENKPELEGLSAPTISGFAAAARKLGMPAKWAIRNTRSAVEPVLTFGTNRVLREKVWKAFYGRGDNGTKNDNNSIITQILSLRQERAKLLGYETHAHLVLEPRMAKTPENAMQLMMQVWPKAVERVKEEVADMQKLADEEKQGVSIEAWDYRYYAEKVRKAKYDLDSNEVVPYLQLEKLVEASHWMAETVFGLKFTRVNDVPVFHPDVRSYKVTDGSGKLVGLWYLDPYARDGKRSGAWMTSYRRQSNLDGNWITPIVSNNSNFIKTDDGKPVLIQWIDAVTLFHEFGHALHGLSSNVTYPSQSGTAVPRDYVEFPSQLIEHWFPTKEVLTRFALHYETGKAMPDTLLEKINRAATFKKGFDTVEYLSAALIDLKAHLTLGKIDPVTYEKETLTALGMPEQVAMRHRMPHFMHIFNGGYEAGYYSYLWSDALTADAADLFQQQEAGFYDKETVKSLIKNVFSVGNTIDPADGFRAFRGRDVDTKALLRKRGFAAD